MKESRSECVTLSLISHTNVGKTTLARTLLRRNVGVVADRPHVTESNVEYVMVESDRRERLLLWDTPGFGDSARLLKELMAMPQPVAWMTEKVWEGLENRSMWFNQQAIRNIREVADVVLYLVNSAESPADAPYARMEMQILEWLAKPVIVLLNQIGAPREPSTESHEQKRWEDHLQDFEVVKDVLSLDAFARCWIQEDQLLARVEGVLPFAKRKVFQRLRRLWDQKNREVFRQSMDVVARLLAATCVDSEPLPPRSWPAWSVRLPLPPKWTGESEARKHGMRVLAERLDHRLAECLNALIRLHELEGRAAEEIARRLAEDYAADQPVSEGISAVLGAILSGAIGGVGADLLSGGISFGSGAILGGIMGALGAGGAAKGYNLVRGEKEPRLRWSLALIRQLTEHAILRYLAVAHFGRGRGHYRESEFPPHWKKHTTAHVHRHQATLESLWHNGRKLHQPEKLEPDSRKLMEKIVGALLSNLYPEAPPILSGK